MSTILRNKWRLLAGVLLTLSVIVSSLGFGQATVQAADSTTKTLTVDLSGTWLAGINVELWSSEGATKLWTQYNQQGAVRTYNVAPSIYDVKLVQGPKVLVIDNLDCNNDCNAGDVTSVLTVDLSGTWLAGINVELYKNDDGLIWTAYNQQGAVRVYNVLKNTYDLKLRQGPKVLDVANIDCTGETCAAGDVIETLTVDLSGSWLANINVELYVDDDGIIWTAYNQQDAVRVYNVLKNTYDLKLRQGPKVMDVANLDCSTDCNAGDVTAVLTVDLSGTWLAGINVELYKDDGGIIWTAYNQHGASRIYNVLKNTYDLKLRQGPKVLDVANIDCTGEICSAGDVTAELTVDLSGTWLGGINVELYKNDDGLIWTAYNQHGASHVYNVLKNTYDLKLRQGPKVLDVANINCTDEACTAGDVIETLTVDLSGSWLANINVELYVDDDGIIWTAYNQQGGVRTYNVLPNTYDLKLRQGPKVLGVPNINCKGGGCTAGDVIAQLAINLTGLGVLNTELHLNDGLAGSTGSLIWTAYNQSGTPVYNVLKNHYDVLLRQGSTIYSWDAVDCTGDTCGLNQAPTDSTPPAITPMVSGTKGNNDWYTSDVTLTWTVNEPESLASLVKIGCDYQNITADQSEKTYSCLATSDGGSAGPVKVAIKRDATLPEVTVTGVMNGATYPLGSVPEAGCNTTDATSYVNTSASLSLSGGPVGSIIATCSGASDNAGNKNQASVTYTVVNAPPTVDAGGPYNVDEGSSVSVSAIGNDPEGGVLTYAWDLNNDGSFETPGQSVSFSAAGLDGPDQKTIIVQATDLQGLTAVDDATVNIANVTPTVSGLIIAPLEPVAINTLITVSASFTDPGVLDTHTAVWDWGVGSSAGIVSEANGSGSASGSHTYTTPGVYTVKLTVTDNDGAVSNESVYQYVVVYDPSGGFVTGGGWITSPLGAYTLDPKLTGKATFGFVAKYKKGATVPDGNTEFQFKAGNLNFKSTSYEWLVVAGTNAKFKGVGTINGQGVYKFMLSADDDKPDTFRIQIWGDNGTVYDNGSQQPLGGGSIVIHK